MGLKLRGQRIYCHPDFKKKIHIKAVNKGLSIIDLTKQMSDEMDNEIVLDNWQRIKAKKNEKKNDDRFNFRL